jgi:hypothetical protein
VDINCGLGSAVGRQSKFCILVEMKYTLEEIYCLVGKDDKTASLSLNQSSEAFNEYGSFITVVFIYTQKEREKMDLKIKATPFSCSGKVRAKYLGIDLEDEKVNKLKVEGIDSNDILEINYLIQPNKNTFHSKEKRALQKLEIKINQLPKGRDLGWIYGFHRKLVTDDTGLSPNERHFYLAGKYFYEPDEISKLEEVEIFPQGGKMKEDIEWEYLTIKCLREELDETEKRRLVELFNKKKEKSIDILDKYLKHAGSSLKKLVKENIDQAVKMYGQVMDYREKRLNVGGRIPIYIDLDSYLHIYMRHVEEMQVNKHFEHKDNFQWEEQDVAVVMGKIIQELNDEIQKHFKEKSGQRYSRYGGQSMYFQGDYYTFHIEPDGRVSTFHKNRKEFSGLLFQLTPRNRSPSVLNFKSSPSTSRFSFPKSSVPF